jgi:hypothetical protein
VKPLSEPYAGWIYPLVNTVNLNNHDSRKSPPDERLSSESLETSSHESIYCTILYTENLTLGAYYNIYGRALIDKKKVTISLHTCWICT